MTPARAESDTGSVLALEGVAAGYGTLEVIRDVRLTVHPGEVVALLGPNGAGKSTTLRAAAGVLRARAGSVLVDGQEMTGLAPFRRQRAGLCFVPEGRGVFKSLTVRENINLQVRRNKRSEAIERVVTAFPALGSRMQQVAGTLSGGEQQMLALARCYVQDPKIILVDEVSMGLAPLIVDEVFVALAALRDRGVAMVLVEQYVDRALAFADSVCVMTRGTLRFAGKSDEVDRDELMSGYLGHKDELADGAPHV